MRVLWFLPKWPYPANDGATRAHIALLSKWPKDFPLDIVVFSNEQKTNSDYDQLKFVTGANKILKLPILTTSKKILALTSLIQNEVLPTTVKKFASKKAMELFLDWSKDKVWTHWVFDGIHTAGLFYNNSKLALPLNNFYIVRAHNVEKDLWTQMAQKNSVPLKWIYQIEQKKMAEFEKNLYVRSDLIAAVSETDQQKIMQIDPKIKAITTSIGLQWDNLPQYINQGNLKLFFIGRLDWYPNSEGLIWFLENVWNEVIKVRSDIALDIVGGFASEKLESLIKERLRVNYHRQVNDISKFYQQCSLTIIPIWTGSGTRVKAIEAATFGRSFLSTTKGIEGINLDQKNDYLKADSKEEWIKILKEVTIEKSFELGKNLFDKVKKEYDQTIIQKDFIKNLKELKHD